jgi:phage terminase large subunit-like protein
MVEGESGILAKSPPDFMPAYIANKRLVQWPNGAIAKMYSAEKPNQFRGPQHHKAWADELAAWRYPDTWDQMLFGLRLGQSPQVVVTTTPRPTPLVKSLVDDAKTERVRITTGSTFDNQANLASDFITDMVKKYQGTRLGLQELLGSLLLDVPGALWTQEMIAKAELRWQPDPANERRLLPPKPEIARHVVAVDIAVSTGPYADETGIILAGKGADGFGYVLEDHSGQYKPEEWARKAVLLAHENAAIIVGEVNQGGDLVEHAVKVAAQELIREGLITHKPMFKAVRATKGKAVRAEPVSMLYEQERVKHVGHFSELSTQLTNWDPNDTTQPSPDRLDALVWAFSELFVLGQMAVPYKPSAKGRSRWS